MLSKETKDMLLIGSTIIGAIVSGSGLTSMFEKDDFFDARGLLLLVTGIAIVFGSNRLWGWVSPRCACGRPIEHMYTGFPAQCSDCANHTNFSSK